MRCNVTEAHVGTLTSGRTNALIRKRYKLKVFNKERKFLRIVTRVPYISFVSRKNYNKQNVRYITETTICMDELCWKKITVDYFLI